MEMISAKEGPVTLTEFERTVADLDQLETMPAIAQRLLQMTSDPDCEIGDVYDVVSADPAMSARMLKVAGSAAFGARAPATLKDALVRIGLKEIRKIVVTAALMAQGPRDAFAMEQWELSLRTAALTEALVVVTRRQVEDPFLCGLLHDFGAIVLHRMRGDSYAELIATTPANERLAKERATYGCDHTDVGAMVAAQWNLFMALEHVMQLHHAPFVSEHLWLPDHVISCLYLCTLASQYVLPEEDRDQQMIVDLCTRLNVDEGTLERGVERGVERFDKLYASLLSS